MTNGDEGTPGIAVCTVEHDDQCHALVASGRAVLCPLSSVALDRMMPIHPTRAAAIQALHAAEPTVPEQRTQS